MIVDTPSFRLAPGFLLEMRLHPVAWGFGALSWFTFRRTYSRGGETWHETCQRVIEGMYTILKWRCSSMHLPFDDRRAQRDAQDAYRRMFAFKWLPPGRGLWMMGTDFVYEEGGAALNNCGFVSTGDIDTDFAGPFRWMFEMLMLGVGIGFDTRGAAHRLTYPREILAVASEPFEVADTRKGWADALGAYLEARAHGVRMTFDVSKVRPYGTPIKRFGGTASGPAPLVKMFHHLDAAFARAEGEVTSELLADIANIIGLCVVAGNVRRSAQIALGDLNDETFAGLKSPDRYPQGDEQPPADGGYNTDWLEGRRPWMFSSNNSLTVRDDDHVDFASLVPRIVENGEPGFFWLDRCRTYGRLKDGYNAEADYRVMGTNPCSEQSLENYELCCLVETFPARHDDMKDYQATLKVAYLYAKTVTCLQTHSERTNAVMRSNSRIGCSMSGIAQAIEKHGAAGFFRICDMSYAYVDRLDKEYSRWLASPRSIKMTSVKPSGTVSLLAGATPGCHDDHSPFAIRRVRVAKSNPIHEHAAACGYHVEEDAYQPNTMVISFPTATQGTKRSKSDVSMWEQLERVAKLQYYWADNQVSATVTFNESEIPSIASALDYYQDRLKSVSLLANIDGSGSYTQMPYEKINEEAYKQMVSAVDAPALMKFDEVRHDQTERFCDGEACEVGG